jgi:low affinity Fe/Cu permease
MVDRSVFGRFAKHASHAMGHPMAFGLAVLIVVCWALTGPFFDFSDTWQLVINTSTTIVTFLMVFLIQHTQNRDSAAMQLKLDELIRANRGAHNALLDLEELEEEDLEHLRGIYEELARRARTDLKQGLLDTGTPEAGTEGLGQALARMALFDQQGRVIWSGDVSSRPGGPEA